MAIEARRGFDTRLVEMANAEERLAEFIRQAWPIIEPATPYVHNWHIDLIAEHLEAVSAGQIKRLIVNIPPRHMKSNLISVMWPAWEWGPQDRPWLRWMFASYSGSLSVKHSRDRRVIMTSDWYRSRWGRRVRLTKELEEEVENSMRGHMIATSTSGGATGKGGNRVIIDDLLDPEQAFSKTERETANRAFDQKFSNRLDNPKQDVIVIVMQRLHEEDLTGHILANLKADNWVHLRLPTEAEGKTVITFPRSGATVTRREGHDSFITRDGKKHRIKDGGLLWPSRFGLDEVTQAKARGSYYYAGQHQQRPAPLGGGIIQESWFRYWTVLPTDTRRVVISADTAFKEKQQSDYSVFQVWCETNLGFFLLDQFREHASFPTLKRAAVWYNARWTPMGYLIEDAASGQDLIAELRRPMSTKEEGGDGIVAPSIPVIPIPVNTDKVSRASATTPLMEAGLVWLPAEAPWLQEFLREVTQFPNAAHDDQVDAMAIALNYLRRSGSLLEFYRRAAQTAEPQRANGTIEAPAKPAPANSMVQSYNRKLEELLEKQKKVGRPFQTPVHRAS